MIKRNAKGCHYESLVVLRIFSICFTCTITGGGVKITTSKTDDFVIQRLVIISEVLLYSYHKFYCLYLATLPCCTKLNYYAGTRQVMTSIINRLRWLDTVFQDQYLPSLSINYVAINKVLEKLPPQLY